MKYAILIALTLTAGCPAPLTGCEWANSEVGQYQTRLEDGGCLALNIDPSDRIIGVPDFDVTITATGEVGDLIEVVSGRRTAVVDKDLACFYTENDDQEGCDSIRVACGAADGDPSVPLASTRVRILVNGEEVEDFFVVSERFAIESGLIQ